MQLPCSYSLGVLLNPHIKELGRKIPEIRKLNMEDYSSFKKYMEKMTCRVKKKKDLGVYHLLSKMNVVRAIIEKLVIPVVKFDEVYRDSLDELKVNKIQNLRKTKSQKEKMKIEAVYLERIEGLYEMAQQESVTLDQVIDLLREIEEGMIYPSKIKL